MQSSGILILECTESNQMRHLTLILALAICSRTQSLRAQWLDWNLETATRLELSSVAFTDDEEKDMWPADLNGDGLVGAADLMVLLGVFGGTDPVADIDGDGSVGVSDLTTLLGQWGMVDCG